MSRWTNLKSANLAALFSLTHYRGKVLSRAVDKAYGKKGWAFQKVIVTAFDAQRYCEERQLRVPPLLLELIADEREYPQWLYDLTAEWRVARVGMNARAKARQAAVPKNLSKDEWLARAEQRPELERRGYLDDGLPEEAYIPDKWMIAGEDDGKDAKR